MALAIMLVFGVIAVFPTTASANYGYGCNNGCGQSYFNPYGTSIGGNYGYNRPNPTPIVVQQPVYIQQPQPIYVQPQPVYVQPQPVVIQQPTYYSPLTVSCSANNSYSSNGAVTWTAYVTGGNYNNGYYNNYNNNYTYSWSGTDGLYGSGQSVYFNYINSGIKYATVTVYGNGQTVTQSCSNTVSVNYPYSIYQTQPVVYQPNYVTYQNNNSLDIGCFVDPTNSKVNQPVTWSTEVTGGIAPYIYSWTGSDGLTGSGISVTKYYDTTGSKSAIVTVTSADGKTGTRACSNTLTVGSTYRSTNIVKTDTSSQTVTKTTANNANQTASSILSLDNVPWGWVAILIILVLFFTVMYLLFNRKKI